MKQKLILVTFLMILAVVPARAQFNNPGTPSGPASGDLSGTYPGPTVAKTNGSAFTAYATDTVGQLNGTTTNDNASAGNIGEYVSSGISSFSNIGTGATTVTISIASPAVITWASNPYYVAGATGNGCASIVVFSTTGALPTGLTATTTPYYVTCDASFTSGQFHVSTSVANAIAGTAVNTSGTQSGTQSASTVFGLSTGSATDIGGMSLTAGDWDVGISGFFGPASTTSITSETEAVTGSSSSFSTLYSYGASKFAAEVPTALNSVVAAGPGRISLSGTTTVFCDIAAAFSVSTMNGGGFCHARRRR